MGVILSVYVLVILGMYVCGCCDWFWVCLCGSEYVCVWGGGCVCVILNVGVVGGVSACGCGMGDYEYRKNFSNRPPRQINHSPISITLFGSQPISHSMPL